MIQDSWFMIHDYYGYDYDYFYNYYFLNYYYRTDVRVKKWLGKKRSISPFQSL